MKTARHSGALGGRRGAIRGTVFGIMSIVTYLMMILRLRP